jgi:hypothetical protein
MTARVEKLASPHARDKLLFFRRSGCRGCRVRGRRLGGWCGVVDIAADAFLEATDSFADTAHDFRNLLSAKQQYNDG